MDYKELNETMKRLLSASRFKESDKVQRRLKVVEFLKKYRLK